LQPPLKYLLIYLPSRCTNASHENQLSLHPPYDEALQFCIAPDTVLQYVIDISVSTLLEYFSYWTA